MAEFDTKAIIEAGVPGLLRALAESHDRLEAEVAALRASRGQSTGAEPVGCPCPGACSAIAVQARADRLAEDLDRLREALKAALPMAAEMAILSRAVSEGDDYGAVWESVFPAMGLTPGCGELAGRESDAPEVEQAREALRLSEEVG